ncbi:MAG: UDP-N-acetylmuramoyl-tripeptide--D-alanyl-D-alanine ligase [Candidatus Niyogibacteria bacterium]|nr:UDP-N-acetylmuramoyl-tripeptide--D-alanyl-D-alanine ligase [Candidatus Niyogibacteria bacterium]
MKTIFKKIIITILRFEARLILYRYKPKIIGITGNVGKTSAKEAIAAVFSRSYRTRKSIKSYNSELGVPLAILGKETAWSSVLGWFFIILHGLNQIIFNDKAYPEVLILEMGADRPGDLSYLTDWIRPDLAVVTTIGEVPAHVEFFSGSEALAREKAKILRYLGVNDWAALNFDDEAVLNMKEKTKSKIITFGFNEGADLWASNYQIIYQKDENGKDIPIGISFKVDYKGATVPIRLPNTFGKQQVYAALAAVAAGISQNFNLIEISEALSKYNSPPGRLKLLEGIRKSRILDDTYNSSPQALHAALDVLRDIPAGRKIAVLGDMLELGKHTIEVHQEAGRRLKGIVDILLTVGPRGKFIAEEAGESGFNKENIYYFSDSRAAGKKLQDLIKEDDLILIKGSQGVRMERITEEVMAHPEEAEKLLTRQDPVWKNKE